MRLRRDSEPSSDGHAWQNEASGVSTEHEPPESCSRQRIGRLAGRYRPLHEIASGGMSTVYLARDMERMGSHAVVALKRLHPRLEADETFRRMFADEVSVASRIRHPNVAAVLDYSCGDAGYYLVEEYLEGEPLSVVRRAANQSNRCGAERAALIARIICDAAQGLHAAHELCDSDGRPLSLVHRDISPQNMLVTYQGVTKLIDFGIAKTTEQSQHTRTGFFKGKVGYLQPEVLRGKRADRRADVWGLGVVLWELLTGRRLFRRRTDVATLGAVLDASIVAPSRYRRDLPKEYDEIVLRALSRDRELRFASARDLGSALIAVSTDARLTAMSSDVAEWMDELFPGGRAQKLALIEAATRVGLPPASLAPEACTHVVEAKSYARMARASCSEGEDVAGGERPTEVWWPENKSRRSLTPTSPRHRAGRLAAYCAVAAGAALAASLVTAAVTTAHREPVPAQITREVTVPVQPATVSQPPQQNSVVDVYLVDPVSPASALAQDESDEPQQPMVGLRAPPGVQIRSFDPAIRVSPRPSAISGKPTSAAQIPAHRPRNLPP